MSTEKKTDAGMGAHERRIHDAWDTARQYVTLAAAEGVDPRRARWPIRQQPRGHHRRALQAHTSIIQFRDEINPFRAEKDEVEERWEEEITTVEIFGEDYSVSLRNLDEWEHWYDAVESRQIDSVKGETSSNEPFRVLLPVSACRACYRHLCVMSKLLGFAATVSETNQRTEITDELIEEVEAWRKQNLK